MSLPQIAQLEFAPEEQIEQYEHREYAFDFNTGQYILVDGNMILLTGKEALSVWIQHILMTIKNSLLYKGTDYGSDYHNLIGRRLPSNYILSEIERDIKESLMTNQAIISVSGFSLEQDGSHNKISFTVESIYGSGTESVVI